LKCLTKSVGLFKPTYPHIRVKSECDTLFNMIGFATCPVSLKDLKGKAADGGTRLVNAKAVDGGNEFPFVAAYFIFGKTEMSRGSCFLHI
jgi:hypothetical protein